MVSIAGGKAVLRRLDHYLRGWPESYLRVAVFLLCGMVLYLDFIAGPRIPLSVFYLFTLYCSIKYIGRNFSYLLVLFIALGKTYVKLQPHLAEVVWWHWLWQFVTIGSIYWVFCYLMDAQLSGRKHAEAELGDLRQLSEAIIGKTDSGILFFGPDGECLIANQAAANILGSPREQLMKCNFMTDAAWPFPSLLEAGREAMSGDVARKFTARLAASSGQEVWCAISAGAIRRAEAVYLLIVFTDVSAYKAAEDARLQANIAVARADDAERKLISIGEEVQQRIGRELHDDLGQYLMGGAFLSEALFQKLKEMGLDEMQDASKITTVLNEAISRTRQMAQCLYPVELQQRGLSRMLEIFSGHVEAMYRVECDFIDDGRCQPEDPEITIHLFRIVQEAVSNAVRHGHASRIGLRIAALQETWMLEVLDDGCGLGNAGDASKGSGIGMRSMRYRADLIGATLQIAGRSEGGTRVALSFPLEGRKTYAG